MREEPPARSPCVLPASPGLEQKWTKIHNPNTNSLSDKESTRPSKRAHSLGPTLNFPQTQAPFLKPLGRGGARTVVRITGGPASAHAAGEAGGAAPAPPPPHPDPFSKSPPTGCISPLSPTRLPKEVCCAVLQLEMRFPSFPQRAGTGSPRANCH